MKKILITCGLLLLPTLLQAADSSASDDASVFWAILKMIFMLGVVVALIFGTVWLLKKISPQFNRTSSANIIKILSISYLGPKRALVLVEILDRIMLVGVTECDIRLITEFIDPEEIARLRTMTGKVNQADAFSTALASFFKNKMDK